MPVFWSFKEKSSKIDGVTADRPPTRTHQETGGESPLNGLNLQQKRNKAWAVSKSPEKDDQTGERPCCSCLPWQIHQSSSVPWGSPPPLRYIWHDRDSRSIQNTKYSAIFMLTVRSPITGKQTRRKMAKVEILNPDDFNLLIHANPSERKRSKICSSSFTGQGWDRTKQFLWLFADVKRNKAKVYRPWKREGRWTPLQTGLYWKALNIW